MDKLSKELRARIDANRENLSSLNQIVGTFSHVEVLDEKEYELLRDVANRDTTESLWYKVLYEESLRRMSRSSK